MNELKHKYLHMRNSGQIQYQFLIEYYFSKCKENCISSQEFNQYFPMYWSKYGEEIIRNLDKEFVSMAVINKENQPIKFL